MRMLNLGCGSVFHEDWVNIDFSDHSGKVIAYDLRLGIPFSDASFDVVYHSHVLEHMPKDWGEFFLRECYRVLRPGGLLRVVVPDLENITRAYLETVEAVRCGEEGAEERHQWMIVELIDQLTRSQSGGEMLNWWKQTPVPQKEFIVNRLGKEAELGITRVKGQEPRKPHTAFPPIDTSFLLSGERRTWMYDACSLKNVLEQCSFTDITPQNHNASILSEITSYGLDSTLEGCARKPDSLFMEGIKPQESEQKNPRVAIFSTTDSGGAGITALRLHKALRNIHVASHAYVAQQHFFHDAVHVIPSTHIAHGGMTVGGNQAEQAHRLELISYGKQLNSAIAKYPERPQGSEHFSIPGQCVSLENVPFLEDFDILHFHWVAGMIDLSFCYKYIKDKPIVWTLHDMNAFTGGCHYSNGCRKFETICGSCPELGSHQEKDLAFETWKARMMAYRGLNMHVVAPSHWLADEARKSALFKNYPVHVIPYSHPVDTYKPLNRDSIRHALGISPDRIVLFFASQSLSSKRKGGIYLVYLLQLLAQTPLKDKITVLLLGNNTSPEFMKSGIHVECLGFMDEATQMIPIYNAADAMVVPSLEDNQPNVIAESLLCGTPVIAFANTGMQEMIKHEETGFLAQSQSVEHLFHGVLWVDKIYKNPLIRRLCRAHALEKWKPEQGAQQYADLYKSILVK